MKVERMLELEFEKNQFSLCESDYLKKIGFSDKDIEYMKISYCLPYYEILGKLQIYESRCSMGDELLFINDMCREYGIEKNIMIKRLSQIRKINSFILSDNKNKHKMLKRKNK